MSADEYEAITEAEWKVLATTEITHLTDEEKDYLPRAWDEWLARVRRDAAREALDGLAENMRRISVGADEPLLRIQAAFAADIAAEYKATAYPETED